MNEYATFGELHRHLDSVHSSDDSFKCYYCKVSIQNRELVAHLKAHQFCEFHCIYCKSFGANDIATLKAHLAQRHPSKFSFVASRRKLMNGPILEGAPNVTILYVGDIEDHASYSFWKLPPNIDLSCMDPSLYARHTHASQQNMPIDKVLHGGALPQIRFFDTCPEFFVEYNTYFAFKCMGADKNGLKCKFSAELEKTMLRHINEKHAVNEYKYQILSGSSQSGKVTTIATCELECNLCQKRCITRHEFDNHFVNAHRKCVIDATIIQHLEIIQSTDSDQPINSKQIVDNRFLYSGFFTCSKDNMHLNTKTQMIAHHRQAHSSDGHFEFNIKATIFDQQLLEWDADELTIENRKFDRMLAYECYYCSNENRSVQLLFESIDEVEKHRNVMHQHKPLLYTARNLVACADCRTISTVDGIKRHIQREHRTEMFNLTCPTNRNLCICGVFTSNNDELAKHYLREHLIIGCNDQFGDRILKKLHIGAGLTKALFLPECCKQHQPYTTISQAVDHVIRCQNANFRCYLQKKRNHQDFSNAFSEMNVFLDNGLVVKFKTIQFTTIGDKIRNKLYNIFDAIFNK